MSQIVVMGLNFRTTVDDVYRAFHPFGRLSECRMMLNDRQESKGYAFLTYEDDRCAVEAITNMHDAKIDGCKIVVQRTNSTSKDSRNSQGKPNFMDQRLRPPSDDRNRYFDRNRDRDRERERDRNYNRENKGDLESRLLRDRPRDNDRYW